MGSLLPDELDALVARAGFTSLKKWATAAGVSAATLFSQRSRGDRVSDRTITSLLVVSADRSLSREELAIALALPSRREARR